MTVSSKHIEGLLQEAELGIEQAYEMGYEIGYKCTSVDEAYSVKNRFAGQDDNLEIAFDKGVSIGFIDMCYDMEALEAGATIH